MIESQRTPISVLPSSRSVAVRCRGIVKHYGKGETSVVALRGVDLEVLHGELLMIVGPSGCGKTTLISIMAALLLQDAGECEVLGHDLLHMSQSERTRLRGKSVGFVFQLFNLVPTLTAVENIAIPLLINGYSRKDAEARAREMVAAIGVGIRADALPNQMSGGQQQRVAIARALVHDPSLVVCDEPTSNLDHETGTNVMKILRSAGTSRQRALVVVTHDSRILHFADRVARMDDGKIAEITGGHPAASLQ